MTTPTGPLPAPRRSRRPDAVTIVLAVVLLAGITAGAGGVWSLFGRGGGATTTTLVESPPTLPPAPGSQLGPTGSPPSSPARTGGPSATPAETPAATPTPTPGASPAPPTPSPTPAPPTPSAAPGYPTIEDAVAVALARMALRERFAGDCDAAPLDTICGGQLAEIDGLYAWGVGYTGTDWSLGTVVVRQDGAGWHPVLFDPGSIVAVGTAVVGGTGSCASLRTEPRRDAGELACLPDGARVELSGVMTVANGYLWAAVEAGGWLPARWLCGPDCEGVPDTVWSFEPAP